MYVINEVRHEVTETHWREDIEMFGPNQTMSSIEKGKSLSCINLNNLLNQVFDVISVLQATSGSIGRIERSITSERFAFMPNYS